MSEYGIKPHSPNCNVLSLVYRHEHFNYVIFLKQFWNLRGSHRAFSDWQKQGFLLGDFVEDKSDQWEANKEMIDI